MDINSLMDDELLPALFSEESNELDDEEWVGALGRAYQNYLDGLNDEDFIINPLQMEKLAKSFKFFKKMAKEFGGKIEPLEISPKEQHGGFTIRIPQFTVRGNEIEEFCEVIKGLSALEFCPICDHPIEISTSISNVFVPKDEIK